MNLYAITFRDRMARRSSVLVWATTFGHAFAELEGTNAHGLVSIDNAHIVQQPSTPSYSEDYARILWIGGTAP